MADFCNQCAAELALPEGDFAGATPLEEWMKDRAAVVICEGCGPTLVDPHGMCISHTCPEHGYLKKEGS